MSEATSGSAILAGNPAGDGAAGQGSAAVPASNAAAAPAVPGTPDGAVSNSNPPPSGKWYDSLTDADLKGYVENKGWKDPGELAHGYRNLEKLLGSEKIPMPKGEDDAEGWGRVYDSLGRPANAADYKLPSLEGSDGKFAEAAAAKFHELGLSTKQAAQLAEWYNGQAQAALDGQATQSSQQSEQQLNSLKSEWGNAYDENIELGRRAAREFGFTNDRLVQLENAMGTGEMLKFMAQIGRGFTEHNFESGKTTNSFGMTPAAAQTRINDLRNDAQWSAKYLGGDADAKAEMARLMSLAFPDA